MKIIHVVVLFVFFLLAACSSSSNTVISSPSQDDTEVPQTYEGIPDFDNLPATMPTVVVATNGLSSLKTCMSTYNLFQINYKDPILPLQNLEAYDFAILPEYSDIDANTLINFIKVYPTSLDYDDRGYHDFGYFRSFHYIRLLEDNALYRFPKSILITEWKWDRAFNMFMSDDDEVYDVYSSLLLEGLNKELLAPDELSCWFIDHESRLELKLFPIGNEQDTINISYLAQISDSREAAGLFFFITQDCSVSEPVRQNQA